MRSGPHPVFVVTITALLVVSGALAGVGTVAAQEDDGPEPADEIYVDEGGDAVLVYENDSTDAQVDLGVDVGTGLMHALIVTDANIDESDVTGSGTAVLTQDRFTGNGTLSMPQPDAVSELSVDVEGVRDSETEEFDATAHARIDSREASFAALAERAEARGNVTVSSSTFHAAGDFDATLAIPLGDNQHQEFTVTENDGTYVVEADQEYVVSRYAESRWETRERARKTLETQYGSLAQAYGGRSEITLQSYSYTETDDGRHRLAVEYTVTYQDIERGLTRQLMGALASADEVNLDQSELDEFQRRIQKLSVEEVHVRYDQRGESLNAAFQVHLTNYDQAVLAGLDVAEAVENEEVSFGENLQRARDMLEAQRAANLERRFSIRAIAKAESRSTTLLDLEASYRTDNWAKYVQELEARGIERGDVSYEFHARSEGDRIETTAALELRQEDLVGQATDALFNATSEGDMEGRKAVRMVREAEFERGRMDVSLEDGTVRFEVGAAFDNMTALRDALAETEQLPAFSSVVARTEDSTTRTYVRVPDAVGANATEDEVRTLPYVTEDTEVHLPGTWNRTFPEANTESARDYLGLTPTPTPKPGEDGTTTDDGPGMSVPAAVAAVLAVAALLARRCE